MTASEAKQRIKEEFMQKYYEWLNDYVNLSNHDYGWKYGWQKNGKQYKDNQSSVIVFVKYMFSAFRTDDEWEKAGYEREVIHQLNREGFLSDTTRRWVRYRYISQATAKQIYKEMKQ